MTLNELLKFERDSRENSCLNMCNCKIQMKMYISCLYTGFPFVELINPQISRGRGKCFLRPRNPAGADLEHNLGGGGGQEHARGTGRASGGRCPLLRAKRGSFDFFLVQKAHLIIIIIVTKNAHSVLQLN